GPLDGINTGWLAATVGENFPAVWFAFGADFLGINGNDDALRTKTAGSFADKFGIAHRRRIYTDLVSTGVEQVANILQCAHATADGKRNEDFRCHAFDRVQGSIAIFVTGGDIQKGDFIRALFVVTTGDFHRVPGVADTFELHPFHHASLVDIETGNNAFRQTHGQLPALCVSWSDNAWPAAKSSVFS